MPTLELTSGKHEITLKPIRISPEAPEVVNWMEEMWVPFWKQEKDM